MTNLLEDLKKRKIIRDCTNNIDSLFVKKNALGYLGIDPTGQSLHIGHLIPLFTMIKLQKYGYTPFFLIGGATGMIGDPSFKSSERVFLSNETIDYNKNCIKRQIENFLDFKCTNAAKIVDNKDWFSNMDVITFLREAGKEITVSYMMAKDSVSRRINNNMSFTEFSYQILQAYDFYHLHKKYGVNLQIGGGDQWGNITTGIDFIRKKSGDEVHAITTTLLTKKDGTKLGKTENGTIWLNANMTSPYDFYQFWLNLSDEDAKSFINIFSSKEIKEIDEMITLHDKIPENRIIQKQLASEMTIFVHGQETYDKIVTTSNIIFGKGSYEDLCKIKNLNYCLKNIENVTISNEQFINYNSIFDMLCEVCIPILFSSKSELKRNITDNCVMINKKKYNIIDKTSILQPINNGLLIQNCKKKCLYVLIK